VNSGGLGMHWRQPVPSWLRRVTATTQGSPTDIFVLTEQTIGGRFASMHDVAVIEDAAAAEVSLDPIRSRMLAELAEPHTATALAARLGLARQKVNYHIKVLEQHGLVELVDERRKGNMTERVVRACAAAYVISPAALATVAPDPARSPDRLSARWLLALAARLVRETGALITGAARANKPLATFGLDAEVRFAKPADRAAFVDELTDAVTGIVSRYHTEGGRPHRLIVAVHPSITDDADPSAKEQQP
jgi:DNA-binding transcriptional ArsR family regulator